MLNKKNKYIKYMGVIAVFVNGIICSIILNIDSYHYDSCYYTSIGDSVFSNGFNLLLYPETYRGCMLPLIISLMKTVFGEIWGWRILSSLMVSVMMGMLLPYIMNYIVESIKDIISIILTHILLLVFWGDFLQYPLSDMPATFFLVGSVYYVKKIIELINIEKGKHYIKLVAYSSFAAVFGYMAYNCRVTYMYGVIGAIFVLLFFIFRSRRFNVFAVFLLSFMVGFVLITIPQSIINKQYVGMYSPRVYTEQYNDYDSSLQTTQLLWGLQYSRYETYIGNQELYNDGGVYFKDLVGNEILIKESIEPESFKMVDIFKIFIKYPFETIGIYIRHFISLATPVWNQIYITNLFINKNILVIVSLLLWFIFAINIFAKTDARELKYTDSILKFSICIPALLQLFGAPELRFFFPIYIILYGSAFLETDKKSIVYIRKKGMILLFLFIVISFLWITVLSNIMSLNNECVMLYSK